MNPRSAIKQLTKMGMTQGAIATKITAGGVFVTQETISKISTGITKNPRFELGVAIIRLCEAEKLFREMGGLEIAIKAAGGQRALAELLEVTPMTITHWKKRGLPTIRAVDIERVLNGAVTREQLLPNIFYPSTQNNDAA